MARPDLTLLAALSVLTGPPAPRPIPAPRPLAARRRFARHAAGAGTRWPRGTRGDIPGWVMIAIMSAAVVVVLIPLVGPVIGRAFTNAVDSVTNTKSATTGR